MADASGSAQPRPLRRLGPRKLVVFDDRSRYVDRFGLLLSMIILTIVILALFDVTSPERHLGSRIGSLVAAVLVGATLLLALRASGLAHRWQRIADVIVIVAITGLVVITIISAYTAFPYRAVPAPLMTVVLAALAPVVIVRRLIRHSDVTRGTLFGAIAGYLFISITFFYLFLTAAELQGVPFFGTPQPTTAFMYFSLATVSTVGYGDLVANTDLDRLLATSEAIIGQVYLVTFVAMIVGLYASRRHRDFVGD
jgi:hypothetical protein